MKKLLTGVLLGFTAFGLAGCTSESSDVYKNAYITLDVNPSIEIITNDKGDVVAVNGLNADAKVLLVDYVYANKPVDLIVSELLTSLQELGFIDDTAQNEILLTTESLNKEELDQSLNQTVKDFIETSNTQIDILMADMTTDATFVAQAESLGVSVGKLQVMNIIVNYDRLQTLELLKNKSIKELNDMLLTIREERVDLITHELELEYDRLKDTLELQEEIFEINSLIDIVLNADITKLEELLNNKLTVTKLKELLTKLKADVEIVANTDSSNVEVENQITQLKDELKLKKQELYSLDKNNENFDDLKDDLEDLIDVLEDRIEDLEELIGPELIEEMLDEVMDLFEETLEDTYNFDFEDIEDAFEKELEQLEDNFEEEMERKLKEFKDNVNTQEKALKEQLRKEKEALLNLNK